MHRLSYREMASAKANARMKQLFVLLLLVIFGILISVTVNAQATGKRACKILYKKRTETRTTKRHYFEKAGKQDQSWAKRSRVNGQQNHPEIAGEQASTDQLEADGQVLTTNEYFTISPPQMDVIKEMVKVHLAEAKANQQIELPPLQLRLVENTLRSEDVIPFLVAVQFGLTGKTIRLEQEGSAPGLVEQISERMISLGIPAERISISTSSTFRQNSDAKIRFTVL